MRSVAERQPLLHRVRMAGCSDQKYQKWFPHDQRVVGGYKATQTPHELCLIIQDLRGQRTFPTYLAYGASTGGNERLIAENIGCHGVSFANKLQAFEADLQVNVKGMEAQGIKVKLGSLATINPDLVSFSGENAEADYQSSIPYLNKKTCVIILGCNEKYGCPGTMMLWRKLRRQHEMVSVTTDNGIGFVRIRLESIPGETERRRDAQVEEPQNSGVAPYGLKKDGTPKKRPGRAKA